MLTSNFTSTDHMIDENKSEIGDLKPSFRGFLKLSAYTVICIVVPYVILIALILVWMKYGIS